MVLKKIGDFSEYREVTGTPRESYWAYWAIVEERRQATGGGTRPPLPIRIGQRVGAAPPLSLSYSSSLSLFAIPKEEKGRGILLGLGSPSRIPTPGAPPLGRPPLLPLYIRGRGHPKGTPSLLLAMCGAPLHSYTPRSYHRSA